MSRTALLAFVTAMLSLSSVASAQTVSPTVVIGAVSEEKDNKFNYRLVVGCSELAPNAGCHIQFGTDPTFKNPPSMSSNVGQTSVQVWGLQKANTYYFRVSSRAKQTAETYTPAVYSPSVSYKYGQTSPSTPPPAPAAPQLGTSSCHQMPGSTLVSGALKPGASIVSPNKKYELAYQTDGNLVVYDAATRKPLWASNTYQVPPLHLVMQADGALVALKTDGSVAWSTKTHGNPGAYVSLQDDGNVVIYTKECRALWDRR